MSDIMARCGKCQGSNLKPEPPETPESDVYCQDCGNLVGPLGEIQKALEEEGRRLADEAFKGFGKRWK